MKISIVTAAFHLRKTRPFEYYLMPTINFLKDMSGSNIDIHLFTDQSPKLFPQSKNIIIHQTDIGSLVRPIWEDRDWRNVYKKKLKDRSSERFEEKDVPELVGLWLGKFSMMEKIASKYDYVLWQDAGISMYLFNKDYANYERTVVCKPYLYERAIKRLGQEFPLVFLKSNKDVWQDFHGVPMHKYDFFQSQLCNAGFLLSRAKEVPQLRKKIQYYWNLLIWRNHYGTEENPLTMYFWERYDCECLSMDQWYRTLGLTKDIPIL